MTDLKQAQANANTFVITRVFNASRSLVFKAFAESRRIAQWWGPKGFSITVKKHDFRPGGVFHYAMVKDGKPVMWSKFVYREIFAPTQITFINSFADEDGNTMRAPFYEGKWPLEVLINIQLNELDGKTEVVLHSFPIHATEAEHELFRSAHASMHDGFGGAFNQLVEFLSKV